MAHNINRGFVRHRGMSLVTCLKPPVLHAVIGLNQSCELSLPVFQLVLGQPFDIHLTLLFPFMLSSLRLRANLHAISRLGLTTNASLRTGSFVQSPLFPTKDMWVHKAMS